MRVLVTNDDGVGRPGLAALVAAATPLVDEVCVVAPTSERSGSSASLGIVPERSAIRVDLVSVPGCPDAEAYAVDAPPALGVRAACAGIFGWRPDAVLSGINPGFNTGSAAVHSGTVGAAHTAAAMAVPGIAVSTEDEAAGTLATTAIIGGWVLEYVMAAPMGPAAINLNVPALPMAQLAGFGVASPSRASAVDVAFHLDDGHIVIERERHAPPFPVGSEAQLLSDGFVSLAVTAPFSAGPPISGSSDADSSQAGLIAHLWRRLSAHLVG